MCILRRRGYVFKRKEKKHTCAGERMVKIEQEILVSICEKFGLSFVVLFGSQLLPKESFKTDYDIAVFFQDEVSSDRELELTSRFSQVLLTDAVDIVTLNFAHPLIQYEVASCGRLLYEREVGLFDRFRWRAVQRWNDNKKFSDLKLDYIKDYLAETETGT